MNSVSRKLLFLLVSAVVLLAGCAKKPKRPDPSSTVLGPNAGGTIVPQDLGTVADANSLLSARDAGWDPNGQNRTLLQSLRGEASSTRMES